MTDSATATPIAQTVQAIIALRDDEALENALASVTPATAAQAVSAAPTLQQKSSVLWALSDRQRREVLELTPPALIGVLIQNLEEDNRYLLGDLSLRQFRALLGFCSPERKYYWLITALSFTDARANVLPLMLTTREIVDILLTRTEFEAQLQAIADFPLENQRLPPEAYDNPAQTLVDLFGPENFLQQFPVPDPPLAHFLQTILDYDPDRYVDLIREGLRGLNYAENHPDEWETVTEAPVLLDSVEPIEVLPDDVQIPEPAANPADAPPLALVPVGESPLTRLSRSLPAPIQRRVAEDLQHLFIRQAIAEGGSFHLSDLETIARSVEAYLLLGLQAESGFRPEREAAVLAARPLHRVSQSGARVVERLRQVALRLQPLSGILGAEQRALIHSIVHPRLTTENGRPILYLLPGEGLPDSVDLAQAGRLLQDVVAWTELARALGAARVEEMLRADATVPTILEELALAAALYARVELGLVTPDDVARFARRYVSPEADPDPDARAREGLERVTADWATAHQIDPSLTTPLFAAALERLAAKGAVA